MPNELLDKITQADFGHCVDTKESIGELKALVEKLPPMFALSFTIGLLKNPEKALGVLSGILICELQKERELTAMMQTDSAEETK